MKRTEATICGLRVSVKKNFYTGLWEICYDNGTKWAGPYATRKEAVEVLDREKVKE